MIRTILVGTTAGILLLVVIGWAFLAGCPLVDCDTIAPF